MIRPFIRKIRSSDELFGEITRHPYDGGVTGCFRHRTRSSDELVVGITHHPYNGVPAPIRF